MQQIKILEGEPITRIGKTSGKPYWDIPCLVMETVEGVQVAEKSNYRVFEQDKLVAPGLYAPELVLYSDKYGSLATRITGLRPAK